MNPRTESVLKELRERLEAIYGERLGRIVLFGSHARGDADSGSDIDVLVVLRGNMTPSKEIERTEKDVADISLRSDLVVCCTFVSEDQFNTERSPLLLNVRREGVPV